MNQFDLIFGGCTLTYLLPPMKTITFRIQPFFSYVWAMITSIGVCNPQNQNHCCSGLFPLVLGYKAPCLKKFFLTLHYRRWPAFCPHLVLLARIVSYCSGWSDFFFTYSEENQIFSKCSCFRDYHYLKWDTWYLYIHLPHSTGILSPNSIPFFGLKRG